jgi:hypothetical protein
MSNTPCPHEFKIRIVGGGVQTGSTRHVGHYLPYCTCPGWLWGWRIWWNKYWQGKPKNSKKTCPSATLSATNPTWPDPGSNPGRRGGKPEINSLSYGAAPQMSCKMHWRWRWNFRKCIIPGKLYQLCHLNNKHRYWSHYVVSLSYQQFWSCTVK